MSRKEDLEKSIRESHMLIVHYEAIQRDPERPEEQKRAARIIEEQGKLIKDYLNKYLTLCQQSDAAIPTDIAQIALLYDDSVSEIERISIANDEVAQSTLPIDTLSQQVEYIQHGLEAQTASRRKLVAAIIIAAMLSLLAKIRSCFSPLFDGKTSNNLIFFVVSCVKARRNLPLDCMHPL